MKYFTNENYRLFSIWMHEIYGHKPKMWANVESHSDKMYFLYLKMQDIGQCNGQKKFLVRFRHCLYPLLSSQNQFGFGLRHEIKIKQNLNQMFWEKKLLSLEDFGIIYISSCQCKPTWFSLIFAWGVKSKSNKTLNQLVFFFVFLRKKHFSLEGSNHLYTLLSLQCVWKIMQSCSISSTSKTFLVNQHQTST